MNPIHLIYKPGAVVKHYLENPSISKALLFVLLPAILSLIGLIVYGFEVSFFSEAFNFLYAVLAWIVASILLSLIISLFSRKNTRNDFYGIASAVSLTRFLGAAAVFLFLLVPLILPGEIFSSVKDFQTGKITLGQSAEIVSASIESENFVHAIPAVSAILLLTIIFALLSILVYYKVISHKINSNVLVHFVALLCFLFLDLVLVQAIGF
ncbi:MAG: hypothetical protein ABH986_02060 [archaeon]